MVPINVYSHDLQENHFTNRKLDNLTATNNHHLPFLNSKFNRRQQQQKIRTVTKICIIFNVKSLKEQEAILLQLGTFLCFNCFDVRNSGFLFFAKPKFFCFTMPVCNNPTAGSCDFDKICSCFVLLCVCFDIPMLAEAIVVNFPVKNMSKIKKKVF